MAPAPFEILLPEGARPPSEPKLAAHFVSLLHKSALELNTVEAHTHPPLVLSNNPEIQQFMNLVRGAKQLEAFLEQAYRLMFPAKGPGVKGTLCCVVQGQFHEFEVFEVKPAPAFRWEIKQSTRNA